MATVALGILGGIIGGPVGANIGVAIGSYIDMNYTLSGLFKEDQVQPRVNDFGLSGLSPGEPIPIALGDVCRYPAQYIWVSDVRELKGNAGGKHAGGQASYVWNYQADVALSLGIGPFLGLGNTAPDLLKLFADNQPIYDTSPTPFYGSNDFELDVAEVNYIDPETGAIVHYFQYLEVHEGTSGYDLSVFRPGGEVVTFRFGSGTGYNNSPNQVFTVLASGPRHPSTGKSYVRIHTANGSYEATPAYGGTAVLGGAFSPASITYATSSTFSTSSFSSITFYPGYGVDAPDPRQPIDSTIFSTGNETEAFGHTFAEIGWLKILNLNLNPYGNRFPMFEVMARESVRTYPSTIARLLEIAGFDPTQFDLTGIDAVAMRGYVVRGPQPLKEAIQPLGVAREIVAQEDGEVVKLFEKKNAQIVDIDDEDLGAALAGEQRYYPVRFANINAQSIPSEVVISYNNIDKDNQPDAEPATVHEAAYTRSVRIQLPLTMTRSQARAIAERTLWAGVSASKLVNIQLPFKYVRVAENTKVRFNAFGRTWTALVTRCDRSAATGAIELEAMVENVRSIPEQLYPSYEVPISGTTDSPGYSLFWDGIDSPGFFEDHLLSPGIYVPATPYHSGPWGGGNLMMSEVDAEDYDLVKPLAPAARMGVTTDVLPSGSIGVWDLSSTVNVRLYGSETLESRTEDEVLGGANHGIIGGELIAWQDVTLEADGTWTLSKLLRGLRDSEVFVGSHVVNEVFYQIQRSTCNFVPLPYVSSSGRSVDLKPATVGTLLENVEKRTVRTGARNMRPFTPINLSVTPSSDGWNVEWEPVTRSFYDPFVGGLWDSLESVNKYQIEVFADGDDPIVDAPSGIISIDDGLEAVNVTLVELAAVSPFDGSDDFILAVRQVGRSGLSRPAYVTITGGTGGTG